jgi:hypothetical protein
MFRNVIISNVFYIYHLIQRENAWGPDSSESGGFYLLILGDRGQKTMMYSVCLLSQNPGP